MSDPRPDVVYAALRDADPDVMDRDELAEFTKQLAAHRAWCDSLQVRATRRQRALADEGRAEAPKDLLAREGAQSARHARTADDREKICTALPNFEIGARFGLCRRRPSRRHRRRRARPRRRHRRRVLHPPRRPARQSQPTRCRRLRTVSVASWPANSPPNTPPAPISPNSNASGRRRRSNAGPTTKPGCATP